MEEGKLDGGMVWYLRKCLYCPHDFRTLQKDKYHCNATRCRMKAGKPTQKDSITIDERPGHVYED